MAAAMLSPFLRRMVHCSSACDSSPAPHRNAVKAARASQKLASLANRRRAVRMASSSLPLSKDTRA
eukprot:scaffold1724_cov341-Pavlova_lutheri.AAC.12